jgi:type IV pilus assembly protein PilA
MSEKSSKPMSGGTKVLIGVGAGCGCLTLGIIPLGILMAIALPSFLNQASKAKQSEAAQYVGAITRSEQAYFLENNKFAGTLAELGNPPGAKSIDYIYELQPIPGPRPAVLIQATPRKPVLKGFIGIVTTNKAGTEALICQSQKPSITLPTPTIPSKPENPLACPAGMLPVR